MAIDFKTVRVNIDETRGKLQSETATAIFSTAVRKAGCSLNGYNIRFSDQNSRFDKPIHEIHIDIKQSSIVGNNVKFTVNFGLRDASGNFDDTYTGWVDVLVAADVA
jgi:hypothetical protein